METYNGIVRTPADAIILFEACRLGLLPRVQRRLSEKERQSIRSGSVFVWDEREAGMRRWTDGKSWSASRVSGSFLTYREMEGKRGGNGLGSSLARNDKTPESGRNSTEDGGDAEEGPDGYRYKPDGLMKQSFSITTSTGQHLHLISYFSRANPTGPGLQQPSIDPNLRHIRPQKGMYPESTVNDQSVPPVTRSPMVGAPTYTASPPAYPRPAATHPHSYLPPGYHPYIYPPSPMGTPPNGYPMHYGPPGIPQGVPPHMSYAPPLQGHPPPHMAPPHYMPAYPPGMPAVAHGQAVSPTGPPSYPPPAQYHGIPMGPPPQETRSPQTAPMANLQIDPRLMGGPANSESTPRSPHQGAPQTSAPQTDYQDHPAEQFNPPTSASEVPSIGALMNGASAAAAAAAAIAQSETSDGQQSNQDATSDDRRSASRSPGGTKKGPKDIPSEKLGFGEDMRVLRQLDKVFTA